MEINSLNALTLICAIIIYQLITLIVKYFINSIKIDKEEPKDINGHKDWVYIKEGSISICGTSENIKKHLEEENSQDKVSKRIGALEMLYNDLYKRVVEKGN